MTIFSSTHNKHTTIRRAQLIHRLQLRSISSSALVWFLCYTVTQQKPKQILSIEIPLQMFCCLKPYQKLDAMGQKN